MSKRFDKRIRFIAECLNQNITDNPSLANEWYIANHGEKLDNRKAIDLFKEWLK